MMQALALSAGSDKDGSKRPSRRSRLEGGRQRDTVRNDADASLVAASLNQRTFRERTRAKNEVSVLPAIAFAPKEFLRPPGACGAGGGLAHFRVTRVIFGQDAALQLGMGMILKQDFARRVRIAPGECFPPLWPVKKEVRPVACRATGG